MPDPLRVRAERQRPACREQINVRDDVIVELEADLEFERRQAAAKDHQ